MPDAGAESRRTCRRHAARLSAACGLGLLVLVGSALAQTATMSAWQAGFAAQDDAVPDDAALLEELEKAVDLRRRENFDRALDAREPGELVEHATLTDVDFDHRTLGIDTLFVVGDELFAYLFRPENGWGGSADRRADDHTPQLRRVRQGGSGGPDLFGCIGRHAKGGPDGAGTQSQKAFLAGDGERFNKADHPYPIVPLSDSAYPPRPCRGADNIEAWRCLATQVGWHWRWLEWRCLRSRRR